MEGFNVVVMIYEVYIGKSIFEDNVFFFDLY